MPRSDGVLDTASAPMTLPPGIGASPQQSSRPFVNQDSIVGYYGGELGELNTGKAGTVRTERGTWQENRRSAGRQTAVVDTQNKVM